MAKTIDDPKKPALTLPKTPKTTIDDPWQFAYHVTGERKIGKTTFATAGCKAFVLQFDKPSLRYKIMERCPRSWAEFERYLSMLEAEARAGTFAYDRIVIDGVAELWQMCTENTCKHFGIEDPGDEGYAKGWRHLANTFNDAVNRLLRLQPTAGCGLLFVSHAEWRETKTRGGGKVDKLTSDLPAKCGKIVNGKVDGWFVYDYDDSDRVLTLLGSESIGAGHRMDGCFVTPDGRRIREVHMGRSAEEGMQNFLAAFAGKQDYVDVAELRARGAKKAAVAARR